MKGLRLSERFFREVARPRLEAEVPGFLDAAAVGLVGEGSECLGFDDDVSRDHDWGAAFCLWLPRAEWGPWRDRVEAVLDGLPETFDGFPVRMRPELRIGRCGTFSIEGFYARFTNLERPPKDWTEWRAIPEHFLAVATDGKVFSDPKGAFTAFRDALLAFYPEDVRLKKMAARCMTMAQAGQYNLPRVLSRGEHGAALLCAARFTEAAVSLTFLLNSRYMPFYKWAVRGASSLPLLGAETAAMAKALAGVDWTGPDASERACATVEAFCDLMAGTLRTKGLTDHPDNWLLAHGPQIQQRIGTPELRSMPPMLE